MVRHCSQRENSAHLGVKGLNQEISYQSNYNKIANNLTLPKYVFTEFNSTLLSSKIIGGETCNYDTFNFALQLLVDGVLRCGAALVTELFAVSAGQCVIGIAVKRMKMRSGPNYVEAPMMDHIVGEERLVEYAIPHPSFDEPKHRTYIYDAAVIKVSVHTELGRLMVFDQF